MCPSLQMGNPTRTFPKLEKAFMENMIQLRKTMDYSDWNVSTVAISRFQQTILKPFLSKDP